MCLADIEQTIKKVIPHVNTDSLAANHETSTRYMIIDPILRALGWDLSDPEQCIVECPIYPAEEESAYPVFRLDYLLLDSAGKPAVLIEAKNILEDTRNQDFLDKMDEYLECFPEIQVGVLTNGEYWTIGIHEGNNNWRPDRPVPLGLNWRDQGETALRLVESLAKGRFW